MSQQDTVQFKQSHTFEDVNPVVEEHLQAANVT
jgi:hypothetical protein